jgi:hypothetical protein
MTTINMSRSSLFLGSTTNPSRVEKVQAQNIKPQNTNCRKNWTCTVSAQRLQPTGLHTYLVVPSTYALANPWIQAQQAELQPDSVNTHMDNGDHISEHTSGEIVSGGV